MARRHSHDSFPRLKRNVVIAGGGLAGLSLAVGLRRRGIPVEVREAGRYPRHRVCGEFISGVEPETLEALGIDEVFRDARRLSSLVWFHESHEIHRDMMPDAAMGISRHRLDQRLKDLLEKTGGVITEGSRCSREPAEGLVWAAGRIAGESPWIGLKGHFTDLPMQADLEMHLGRTGYAGLAAIEDGRVNVCGLFRLDRTVRGSGPALLPAYLRQSGLDDLADRLANSTADERSFLGVSAFNLGWQESADAGITIGDAAAMIPPFTGNGMSMAFQSADAALDPVTAWSEGHLTWEEATLSVSTALRARFHRRMRAARLMQGVLDRPLGRGFLDALGRAGLLPFRPLLSLVR